jgi:benzil reductase ((S)-benzoin forming)
VGALVIVTGGSSGLGRSLLLAAPAGARLVDVSRSGARDVGRDVEHVAADLADPATWPRWRSWLGEAVSTGDYDRITLIHAAGTLEPIGFAGEVDGEAYARNVLLNSAAGQVLGEAFLAVVAPLREARRELVMISSGAARTAYPGWSAYGAGKAGLDHWVRVVAAEQERRGGVRVQAVAPGVVATDMQAAIRATDERDFPPVERFRQLHAEGRLEDPDDVARRLWTLLDTGTTDPVVDLRDHR